MKMFSTLASAVVLSSSFLGAMSSSAAAAEYVVDASHSKVGFSVRHIVGRVTGEFTDYTGTFDFDPASGVISGAKINVQAKSINTGVAKRDDHLRSADFFDVGKFPTLAASAGKVQKIDGSHFKWQTDLTIHGVTKPVIFDLEYFGNGKDPWGNDRAGFQAKTKINRKDFGLGWNQLLESGGVMVGEEIEIVLDIEAIKAVKKTANK